MVMRILFVNGQAFLPQLVGGIETSTLDLCLTLQKNGHDPIIMSGLVHGGFLWLKNRARSYFANQRFPYDIYQGLRVYRGWHIAAGLPEVVQRENPDAVVVQGALSTSFEVAAASLRLGLPTIYYTHDASLILNTTPLPDLRDIEWIANSAFTASLLQSRLNLSPRVIPPLIRAEEYRATSSRRAVTMINPRPIKGGAIAVAMAEQCPDIPFQFVEAWNGSDREVAKLKAHAKSLNNVEWLPVQKNIRHIYEQTRLILAPSQCPETWGRVVTEAQFLGIPTIASNMGALPETVGPGGIVVDAAADIAQWTQALRNLWDDDVAYRRYSDAALNYAQRAEISPTQIAAQFIDVLETLIARRASIDAAK
jgi:glycosyltransferase involved in cell wall biosynthesis